MMANIKRKYLTWVEVETQDHVPTLKSTKFLIGLNTSHNNRNNKLFSTRAVQKVIING